MADDWTDEELAASVEAYREMQVLEEARKSYNKRQVYRELAERFGRTAKAFEYRMQNISAVLNDRGESWIPGLKPATNVGAKVSPRIEALLQRFPRIDRWPKPAPKYKDKLPAMRDWLIQVARSESVVTYGDVIKAFGIDRLTLRHALSYLGHQADNLDEPIITALVVNKRTRRCSVGLENEFGVRDDEAERQRLYEYWKASAAAPKLPEPPTATLEVKAARFVSVEARPDQAAFRRQVFLAYGGRCVVTGCDLVCALDAAHKHGRDWRKGHNRAEDGYLLRKDLHALYDNDLLRISEAGLVELDPPLMEQYRQFAGIKVARQS